MKRMVRRRRQAPERSNRKARSGGSRSYKVGYGRPPQEHQFRPGQSGNPRGRRKGLKNEATILRELLNRKIDIRQGGTVRKITVLEAILLRFTEDALKGNIKTAGFLFNRYAASQDDVLALNNTISDEDRQVLETFVRRFEAQHRSRRKNT